MYRPRLQLPHPLGRDRYIGPLVALALGLVLGVSWYLLDRLARRGRGQTRARRGGTVTQALVPIGPADTPLGPPGANLDQRLDEAVQETFPASDPIAVHIE